MTSRNDRRSPKQLLDLVNRKVRVTLTSWEKRNIKDVYRELLGSEAIKRNEDGCGSCWLRAIIAICKEQTNRGLDDEPSTPPTKPVPVLVKAEKMVKPEPTKPDYFAMKYHELVSLLPKDYKGSKKTSVIIEFLTNGGTK